MRYHITPVTDENFHIFDLTLMQFVRDGKGCALALNSQDEAMEIVDIMVQRVGA